jgi:hypothetical protein
VQGELGGGEMEGEGEEEERDGRERRRGRKSAQERVVEKGKRFLDRSSC